MKKDKILNLILPVISLIVLVVLWEIASLSVNSEYILPDFFTTLKVFFSLFSDKAFYKALLSTLLRSLIAFIFSFIIATVLAELSYKSKTARRVISPVISVIRAMPTIAVILLLLFWTNSYIAPIIVTSLVIMPTLYLNIYTSLSSIDKDVIEMCSLYNLSKKDTFFKVKFPQILPQVLLIVGGGISLNIKLMVASEVLAQTANSMGYLLNTSKVYFEVTTMIALVISTIVLGLIIETAFNLLSKKVGKWQ